MKWLRFSMLFVVGLICINMGEGGRHFSSSGEPIFTPLEEKQGSFLAVVHDEKAQTVVRDISFFGQTSIGGIRRESDDSFNRLEVANLKLVEVVKPNYDSKRYSDKEFSLVKVTMGNSAVINDLLAPKNVVICGVERDTGAEKTWWLRKINKIVIKGKITFDRKMFAQNKKKRQDEDLKKFLAEEEAEKTKGKGSIFGAFFRFIDSFLDFIKSLFSGLLNLVGL